jgi:hypothetical protein
MATSGRRPHPLHRGRRLVFGSPTIEEALAKKDRPVVFDLRKMN